MILEGIVTTLGKGGEPNIAPMGPAFDTDRLETAKRFVLKPFKTSRTYANLKIHSEGVMHVIDDPLLLAEATLGQANPELIPAERVKGVRLADCCRFIEFRITSCDDTADRVIMTAAIEYQGFVRETFGFNRGRHAVVEAAILASRIGILSPEELRRELDRLCPIVNKTGGHREQTAFSLLDRHIRRSTRGSSAG